MGVRARFRVGIATDTDSVNRHFGFGKPALFHVFLEFILRMLVRRPRVNELTTMVFDVKAHTGCAEDHAQLS